MKLVISLGGSLIVPDKVDYPFLDEFEETINKLKRKHKIVILTGGGHTARKYMHALELEKATEKQLGLVGIMSTKLNARLVAGFFNHKYKIPETISQVKSLVKKKNPVICGSLGIKTGRTSDSNAAELARELKADLFINLTNVDGLYDKDPTKYKSAKFIPEVSFQEFYTRVKKIKFKAGQHFVLDQEAAKIIKQSKIKTIILNGKKLKNLENCLNNKKFKGTVIS